MARCRLRILSPVLFNSASSDSLPVIAEYSWLSYYHNEPLQKGEVFWNENGIVPGKNGKPTSHIGKVVDREDFEKLKDEYYELRGWEVASGFPTENKMNDLGLDDIALDLKNRGLLK